MRISVIKFRNKKFLDKHFRILKEKYNNNIVFIGPYKGSKIDTNYKCKIHNYKFKIKPEYVNLNKHSCPECIKNKSNINNKKKAADRFFKNFNKKWGKQGYKLTGKYIDTNTPISTTCKKHGKSSIIPNYGVSKIFPCSQCFIEYKKSGISSRKTEKEFKKEVKYFNPNIKILSDYKGARDYVDAKCKECKHTWKVWADSLVRGIGCPICNNKIGKSSKKEKSLYKFIKKFFPDAINGDRKQINPQELDIYIPSKNFAIEYNGLYWHSDIHKHKNYHKDKLNSCKFKNIKLIFVYEDDWNNKRKVVKRTIKHLLGLSSKKEFARNLELKIYPKLTDKIKLFYSNNHIQSYPKTGGFTYTLIKNKKIIAAMTFSSIKSERGVKEKIGDYELIRFASSGSVIGGASRLFTNFLRDTKVKKVISYSDNDLFDGNLYNILGFKHIVDVPPDYKVVFSNKSDNIRKHKSNAKRKNLKKLLGDKFNPNLSERLNCQANNILRVFDSGKKKWIYNNFKRMETQ